jgi:serine/threonine-protein kinase RsbW
LTVLAVRNTRSHSYPAVPGAVTEARRWAAQAADRAGATPEVVEAVRLAVSEAVTNVVLHAYPDGPGEVRLTLAVADGEFWVLVADDGRGAQSAPVSPGLGWGLALIADACQDCVITERTDGGTELRMSFPLQAARGRPAGRRALKVPLRSEDRAVRPRRR